MSYSSVRNCLRVIAALLAAAVLSLIPAGYARAQNTFGTLSNFDVFNDTGQECHGFEIELDNIASTDVSFTFGSPYQRYGNPQVVNFNDGVKSGAIVRYLSPYDQVNKVFTQGTPMAPTPITPTLGHSCWTGGSGNYLTAGCEHFGIGLAKNPTATAYHWLIADPANPGSTIQSPTKVTVPAPVMNVFPPAVPGGQPVVQAIVPAEPPELQEFGDAQWVKVFKTESPDPADLNHLVTDDPAVPQDGAEVETEWSLLQHDKNAAGGGARKEQENHGKLGNGKQSVTRRYELYKFSGTYDPETHEALPAVSDSSPQPSEIGDYEGAQMAAVNVAAATATSSPTATATSTTKPTATATATNLATATATPTATATATPPATATATAVATATATPLPGQLSGPRKLNFGNAVYGGLDTPGQAVNKLASITNKSKTASAPIDASATGDFVVVGGAAQGCTAQLAAKGKCVIGIKFQPTDFGPRTGKLTIGGIEVSALSGNGVHGKIAVAPGSLNFGKVQAGTTQTKLVTLTNKSPVAIEISDIEIVDDTADFAVDKTCIGALQTTCPITVTFMPSGAGKKHAKLQITHAGTGSPRTINLVGTAF